MMAGTCFRGDDMGNDYTRYIGIGFAFVAVLTVLTLLGFFMDKLLGTLPLFLLAGLGLGFAGSLYYVYLQLKKLGGG